MRGDVYVALLPARFNLRDQILGTAYIRVEWGDDEEEQAPSFFISPVPFLMLDGEYVRPTNAEGKVAASHQELCQILTGEFEIPADCLPPLEYFQPNSDEREEELYYIDRIVPEGAGEPEWRIKARKAVAKALDTADITRGQICVNGCSCDTLEELQHVLEAVAEKAGGKQRIKGEPYQPDYDVVVKEVLKYW